jgi:hypothetical protein
VRARVCVLFFFLITDRDGYFHGRANFYRIVPFRVSSPASNMERALNVYRVYTRRVRDDGTLTARATDRARYYVVRGGKGELSGQRPACTRLRVLTPTSCLSSSRNCTLRPAISPFFSPLDACIACTLALYGGEGDGNGGMKLALCTARGFPRAITGAVCCV